MVMGHIFVEHRPQGVFAEQHHLRQRFLFDRSDPVLRIGMHMRRPRWQQHPFDAGILDELLKGRAKFPIAVMKQVLPGTQVRLRAVCIIQA